MSEAQSLSSVEKAWLQGEKTMFSSSPRQLATRECNAAPIAAETRMDDDFWPSVLTPIHEIPTRSRLHTAETDLIQNCRRAVSMPNASRPHLAKAPSAEELDDTTRDDVSSVVSSLSKDDSLLPRPNLIRGPSLGGGEASPPTEVSIPNQGKEQSKDDTLPDWLSLQQPMLQQQPLQPRSTLQRASLLRDSSAPAILMERSPPPRVSTVFASPRVLRPTLGRNQSSPGIHMDFSVTSKHSTVSSCGDSIDALFNNDTDSLSLSPNSAKLLEGRKMRSHHGARSCGTHSHITAPTLATSSSYAGSEGSSVRRSKSAREASRMLSEFTGADDGAACCSIQAEDSYRKRNLVKEEFRYVMNLVSQPIKKLPLMKKVDPQRHLELQRRKGGCLT